MKHTLALLVSALLVLGSASETSAQLLAAKDGPIVYGHHHLNTTNMVGLEANGIKLAIPYRKVPALGIAIAFITDPWGTT